MPADRTIYILATLWWSLCFLAGLVLIADTLMPTPWRYLTDGRFHTLANFIAGAFMGNVTVQLLGTVTV